MARTLSTDEKLKNIKAQFDKKREEVGKAQKVLAEAESKIKNLQSDMMNLQAKYMNTLMFDDGIDVFDLPPDELKTALKMVSETAPDKSDSTKGETSDSVGNNANNQVNTDNHIEENSPAPEHTSADEDNGYSSEGTAFYV